MSLITISSTNPNLSHILSKNPATITNSGKPFERDVRKGRVYGWFSNPEATQFRLLFIDSPVENSFGESEFEYLDTARYANPYVPIAVMGKALASALNQPSEYDKGDHVTSVTSNIKISNRVMSRVRRMPGVFVSQLAPGYFTVTATSAKSVADALNLFQIICFIACLADEDTYVPLPQEAVEKYIRGLNRIDAPYFLRYLVSSRAINNRDLFAKLEPELSTDSIKLKFGDTQIQRYDEIALTLDKTKNGTKGDTLVDIGCGEMYHTLRLAKSYNSVFAIDADEDIFSQNVSKVNRRMLADKIVPLLAFVDAKWIEENDGILAGADVLISECLEHMELSSAKKVLSALLKSSASKIVVTVPNKDFNVHYGMDENDTRHLDHKWEPGFGEWMNIVDDVLTPDWRATTCTVGDFVQGASPSTMTTFVKDQPVVTVSTSVASNETVEA